MIRGILIGAMAVMLTACSTMTKVDTVLSSDGAKQSFKMACAGVGISLAAADALQLLPPETQAGVTVARTLVREACEGGPPESAAQLAERIAKVAIEDGYLRSVVAKALSG